MVKFKCEKCSPSGQIDDKTRSSIILFTNILFNCLFMGPNMLQYAKKIV
jgi:hypothetical protein